jgi:hypothetical protein
LYPLKRFLISEILMLCRMEKRGEERSNSDLSQWFWIEASSYLEEHHIS